MKPVIIGVAVVAALATVAMLSGAAALADEAAAASHDESAASGRADVDEAPPACPKCGSSENVVPIVYGYPSAELMAAAERGEVKLGGCVITGDDPQWYCKACSYSW